MAVSNTNSVSNTNILHPDQNIRTYTTRKTNNIGSGYDGPEEKLSCFVDKILQPIAQQQKSYLKDTTDFINFTEKTKLPQGVILVSVTVTSLYTNIPQEEGINMVCTAYESFYNDMHTSHS